MKSLNRAILSALVMLFVAASASAKKNVVDRAYMFGIAVSFVDTAVYITDVQVVDGVKVANKMLESRSSYSYQLKEFVDKNSLQKVSMPVIFFSAKRASVEKKYVKMKKKFEQDKSLVLNYIPANQFHFMTTSEFVDDNSK